MSPYDKNAAKAAGILCFWIKKLAPFRVETTFKDVDLDKAIYMRYVNEFIAFNSAFEFMLRAYPRKCIELNKTFYQETIVSLRYKHVTMHSLVAIFDAMISPAFCV